MCTRAIAPACRAAAVLPAEDGSDDDSGDVSLVDEDAMDEDSDEDDE